METERITLGQRERDRLKVLHEVQQRHLTQVAAAARLKVTDRQVRRMLLRIREQGDASLVHGLRGRPSNRKLAARFEEKFLTRVGQRYADFGPTLAAEHLAMLHGPCGSRNGPDEVFGRHYCWQASLPAKSA
jgi:predicted ArsR family transcriptional regulator